MGDVKIASVKNKKLNKMSNNYFELLAPPPLSPRLKTEIFKIYSID